MSHNDEISQKFLTPQNMEMGETPSYSVISLTNILPVDVSFPQNDKVPQNSVTDPEDEVVPPSEETINIDNEPTEHEVSIEIDDIYGMYFNRSFESKDNDLVTKEIG